MWRLPPNLRFRLLFFLAEFVFLTRALPDDASIKIAAYDPKPIEMPETLLTKRVGFADDLVLNLPRPIREASKPYHHSRRPAISPDNRRPRPSKFNRRRIDTNSDDSQQLFVLDSGSLQNPMGPTPANTGIGIPLSYSPDLPQFGSPAPPTSVIGPPSPPVFTTQSPPFSPSPPIGPTNGQSQVTGIKCLDFGGSQTFEAILTLPSGYDAIPVFEDRPNIDPLANPICRTVRTQIVGMYQLMVSDYNTCGVRKCIQSNGETWNCLVLRFPRIVGLKLPEDEIVEIRCRPHDRTADDVHVLAVATSKYADRMGTFENNSPTAVFEGLQEFECEIGLFRQLPGTQQFNTRVGDEAPLELGEKIQLWSIIKEGDGWQYSRLTEVVIQRRLEGSQNAQDSIVLVFTDGCRNPKYKVIAEDHPFRDPTNRLVNKFTFRAFMFQNMEPGESLYITAKVVGCIIEEDCKPASCPDDGQLGYGKRRKRDTEPDEPKGPTNEYKFTTKVTKSTTSVPRSTPVAMPLQSHVHRRHRNVTDWSRNLAIKIRMPDETIKQKSAEYEDCKLYLFISIGVSLFFCVCSVAFLLCSICRRCRSKKEKSLDDPPLSTGSVRKHKKTPLQVRTSLTDSESSANSGNSTTSSDLQKVAVPPTVRKKKREVNAELINMFNDENMVPFPGTYPPHLMNYYGYMVVPKPQNSVQKRTVRATKRNDRSKHDNQERPCSRSRSSSCSCQHDQDGSQSDDPTLGSNHTSVIKITSGGSETISIGSKQRPKPRPRISRGEPIYNEIVENTLPTLV